MEDAKTVPTIQYQVKTEEDVTHLNVEQTKLYHLEDVKIVAKAPKYLLTVGPAFKKLYLANGINIDQLTGVLIVAKIRELPLTVDPVNLFQLNVVQTKRLSTTVIAFNVQLTLRQVQIELSAYLISHKVAIPILISVQTSYKKEIRFRMRSHSYSIN